MQTDTLEKAIARAQAGDPSGFDVLVDAYASRVYGFCYRFTGSRTDAEDLLQEVMLRVVRRIGDYTHRGRFEAWLFRIAANLVRDRARQAAGHPSIGPLDSCDGNDALRQAPDHRQAAPDFRLRLREEVDELQVALERLPVAEREVIVLRHFSEMSFQEIAEAMGAPLGTTLARAHRGLRKLREWLDPEACQRTGTD
ncbi:MAG: sigma-70 family RNA polymerase sigma factor [Phycisphaerales bacterium]|nr:MAG: sigma-70 family RNA polymerase sigma factor [Phycisphaerales bacterium]